MKLFGIICKLLVFIPAIVCLENPYETLGVKHSASFAEIKRAYKNLAKEWHPDKNDDPLAANKFVEINQAYELLSDPERRTLFDKEGFTEDTLNFRPKRDYEHLRRFDHFDAFFSAHGFKFDHGTLYHKQTITIRGYANNVIPESAHRPFLILFYSDWCLSCMQAEGLWSKITEELEPLGVGIATIHAELEQALAKKIGVSSLPWIVAIMDGHVYHYRETRLSFVQVIDFIRKKLPYQMILLVDESNVDDFLNGWIDNRVRVLVFSRRDSIRLRYLLVAFQFRRHVTFGYIQIESTKSSKLEERFQVRSDMDTLLVFKEDSNTPAASLSMSDISINAVRDILDANKYLLLPRLSSQDMFDQLCPPEASRSQKRLCVVLITRNIKTHEPYRQALRTFLQENPPTNDRVRFVYIFADRQEDFLKALTTEDSNDTRELGLVILWRKTHQTLQYRWLVDSWSVDFERVNISGDRLIMSINNLLLSKDSISADAVVKALVDEHVLSIFSRMILKLVTVTQYLKENISRNEALPAISVLLTVVFVVAAGYFMSYLVKLEEEAITEKFRREGKEIPGVPKKVIKEVVFKVHELRGETYNGLVRLLKPGCRTIVLLVDKDSKDQLTPIFYKICYPYRRNKSLMFAFMMLEKNLEWYRRLLIQTLAEPRELNINPKNCIGTVISLNGHRKYFCMYHAKYRENPGPGSSAKGRGTGGGGEFMGFGDSSESSDTEVSDVENGPKPERQSLIQPNLFSDTALLEGLSNWLDRLFEGSTVRYYIKFWPMMK